MSEDFPAVIDALETLYLLENQSGRIKFYAAWPKIADYVFGLELIGFDRDGTADKDRRNALEQEAEARRIALLDIADGLEEKSADKGVLQTDYVRDVLAGFGRDLALHFYAPEIVERFCGAPPAPILEEDAAVSDSLKEPEPEPEAIPNEELENISIEDAQQADSDTMETLEKIELFAKTEDAEPKPESIPVVAEVEKGRSKLDLKMVEVVAVADEKPPQDQKDKAQPPPNSLINLRAVWNCVK